MTVTNSDLLCEDGSYLNTESNDRVLLFYSASDSGSLSFSGNIVGTAWPQSYRDLLCEDGSYLNTESSQRIFLGFGFSFQNVSSLSFSGILSATKGAVTQIVLSATLSFVGSLSKFTRTTFTSLFTTAGTGLHFVGEFLSNPSVGPAQIFFSSFLRFSGNTVKKLPRSFSGTLPFIGTFKGSFTYQKLLAAALAFIGIFKSRTRKLFTASVSFIGNYVTKLNGLILKSLTATLSFSVFFTGATATIYQMILESYLYFHGFMDNNYGQFWVDLSVRAKSVLQEVISGARTLTKKAHFGYFEASVSSTPLETVSFEYGSEIWLKNLSDTDSVQVDSSSDFDKFPQTIPPGSGVFLAPITTGSLFSRSDNPGAIQLIGTNITSTIPPPPPFIWYVQFQVAFNSSEISGGGFVDIFDAFSDHEATDDEWQMAIYPDFGSNKMWFYSNDEIASVDVTFVAGTWYDVGMLIDTSSDPTLFTFTPRFNGVNYGTFTAPVALIKSITFGGRYSFGSPINRNLDNLLIGSTAWGSSDVFSADFTSSIVPPFASIFGSGMSVSGGTMLVNNPASDVYALKAF